MKTEGIWLRFIRISSMFRDFADVKVVGLTAEAQKKNFDSLRAMVEMAAERGIRIKPGIWAHIYRGGGQEGRISWASDGSHPTEGLVWGLNSKNLVPYTIAALDRFYTLFPEIHETQFRLHNESGLLNSEIDPFWHEVFGYFSIPGTFITPQWDMMYYLELIDRNGKGRIFPDLNVETPYVVHQVDHRAAEPVH